MRRPVPDPGQSSAPQQLTLFEEGNAATGASSWVARHWPTLVADRRSSADPGLARAPMVTSPTGLPNRARRLLAAIERKADGRRSCRFCFRELARETGFGRNTCKRHLDKLLADGLLAIKPLFDTKRGCGTSPIGYECRLIADGVEREAALADGFLASRLAGGASD